MEYGVSPKKEAQLKERMAMLGIREEDLSETFIRASGKGGQKVNKTSAGVNLSHIPTGIKIKSTNERSRALNRYYARKRLVEELEKERLGKKSPALRHIEKIRKQKAKRKRRASDKYQQSGDAD